ncbi:M20 family metallopeptidase [Kocuria marina]|uniref:M20 family metallopeptidase n=1 Tax=Kocuria marina TaxID=223184 RepID=UPI003F26DE0E
MTTNHTESTEELKARAKDLYSAAEERILALSHRIHANPELGLCEVQASQWVADQLREVPGVCVEHGLGSLPTAVRAEAGSGDLLLTVCAEYDALPDVGHACGHNIIAASAVGAFTILAQLADDLGITVRLLGTPAEETMGGKITLMDEGFFDGTHAAMMIHPGNKDQATMRPYACSGYRVIYRGRSAHASAEPYKGINALDALTVAMTSIGLARQQLHPHQQIHGCVLRAGSAPNVIPELAEAEYMIRADTVESLGDLEATFRRCLEAGALATGATLELEEEGSSYLSMRNDTRMSALFSANSNELGRPLSEDVELGGSTDMGNVSQRFPSIHPMLSLGEGTPDIHSPAFTEFAGSDRADLAVRDGAVAMAWTCIDLATSPELRDELLSGENF